MAKYEIKPNPHTCGLYTFFDCGGQELYADLCDVPYSDYYNECMIFLSKDEQVTNWSELYCKRDIPVTKEQLTKCVDEFKESITGRLLSDGWKASHDSLGDLVLVRFSDPRIGYKPADGTLIIGYHEYPEKVYTYEQIQKIIDK